MTVYEKIIELINSYVVDVGFCMEDSVKNLIVMAYWIGREEGAKNELDRHDKLARQQKKRAKECRYHKMAMKIIGNTFIYSDDYSQDVTQIAKESETELEL